MIKNYFKKALKVAELTTPKEREIHAVEFWHRTENEFDFKITLDNGKTFILKIFY